MTRGKPMDFSLPEIGEGVYEAELTGWLVRPGQSVKRGQGLAEVQRVGRRAAAAA